LILEEAEKLYNQIIAKLTNRAMAAAAAVDIRASSLPANKRQNDTYQTEIYNNDQEQPNE
jgi:hypothetical protein